MPKKSSQYNSINFSLAYLIGLTIGRGRTYESGRVVIEFSHTNHFISGIARCPICDYIATKNHGIYKCKSLNCGSSGFEPIRSQYDQIKETRNSIQQEILPTLKNGLAFKSRMIETDSTTLLLIDFDVSCEDWSTLRNILGESFNFQKSRFPEASWYLPKPHQIELINGLLDTSGFCNSGGWIPRNGTHSSIRQRMYIQVVRNWHLVVEIDNFLRINFNTPIQTIDWGHPNIRDGNLVDFNAGSASAYSREHQIKIYPEFMKQFRFRISHKRQLFEELVNHNKYGGFSEKEDWFPPQKLNNFRAFHPDETNPRMITEVRRHFDSFWQINLALGCRFLTELSNTAKNPIVFALNGDLEDSRSPKVIQNEIEASRPRISTPVKKQANSKLTNRASSRRKTEDLEFATYPMLKTYFDRTYFDNNKLNGEFMITNYSTVSSFFGDLPESFTEMFEECEEYKIRPDLVGFDKLKQKLIFIESKVDPLDLDMLGQMLGYCLVAEPIDAYLVSTRGVSSRLVAAVSAYPDLLNYGSNSRIKIANFENGKLQNYDF